MSVSEEVAGPSKQSQKEVRKPSEVLACGFVGSGRDVLSKSKLTVISDASEIQLRTGECPLIGSFNGHLGDCSFTKVVGMKACRVHEDPVGPEQKDTLGFGQLFPKCWLWTEERKTSL